MCGQKRAASLFYDRKKDGQVVGKYPYCKPCHKDKAQASALRAQQNDPDGFAVRRRAIQQVYRDGHPETIAAKNRQQKLRIHFGIIEVEYEALLAKQGGVCAICQEPPTRRRLDIDHDRTCCPGRSTCGKCIRGLLCPGCNLAIGRFDKDPAVLRGLLDYLAAWAT